MANHDSDFSLPWCQALLKSPEWTHKSPISTVPTPPGSTENALINDLLAKPHGIRAVKSLIKHDPEPTELSTPEMAMLFSLGPGLNGIDGICHGGIVALLLDEVMGETASPSFGGYQQNIVTGGLSVTYRRPLKTPAVVLCRARAVGKPEGKDGRKLRIRGTVEDGEGIVYAEGESVFVKLKPKM